MVRIEDRGFGGFVKSSGVVVEEEINLETDKIAQKEEWIWAEDVYKRQVQNTYRMLSWQP